STMLVLSYSVCLACITLLLSSFVFFFLSTLPSPLSIFFFFNDPATTEIYTLSLHDALPIYEVRAELFDEMAPRAFCADEERPARTAFEGCDEPFLRVHAGCDVGLEPLLPQSRHGARADRGEHGRPPVRSARELPRAVWARDDHAVVPAYVNRVVRERLDSNQRCDDDIETA